MVMKDKIKRSYYLPKSLMKALDDLAKKEGRPSTAQFRLFLEENLKKDKYLK